MERNDSWPAYMAAFHESLSKDHRASAASAYRVPNLQLDLFVLNVDHARAELDADCQIMHGLEALVRELQQQTRLADAWNNRHERISLSSLSKPKRTHAPVSPMMMYLNRYA